MIIALKLTRELINDCAHSGKCDSDVAYWLKQPRIASQLSKLSNAFMARCLKGYGAWTASELRNRSDNEMRILWTAACDAREQLRDGIQCPCTVYLSEV